ncbi:MAG: SAM-dependent methyltransferase [Streptosporangiaceae bacterium]|nr:SAM-dependent methyltransferase [Streptosporangiaceae bacterium]
MVDSWSCGDQASDDRVPPGVDAHVAHIARVYDYWLGGKDNFAADRHAAEQARAAYPDVGWAVRAQRSFLGRAVRYLAAEAGIRQFLDIGTGIPAANNTHEVAQSVAPECRIVYVDNDPMVLLHARALLKSKREGVTAFIDADLRDPGKILTEAAKTLDFARPVAILLVGILQFIPDEENPYAIVAELMRTCAPGSFLVISHPADDIEPEAMAEFARRYNELAAEKAKFRSYPELCRFFDGVDLVEPGVVKLPAWRPDSEFEAKFPTVQWVGVAQKR